MRRDLLPIAFQGHRGHRGNRPNLKVPPLTMAPYYAGQRTAIRFR